MSNIQVTLPDGSIREVAQGTTALQVAEQISPGLARVALVAKIDGTLVDLATELNADASLQLLTDHDEEALGVYRHSSAHLLAAATLRPLPAFDLHVELVAGMGVNTFPFPRGQDETLNDDELVIQQYLTVRSRQVRVGQQKLLIGDRRLL